MFKTLIITMAIVFFALTGTVLAKDVEFCQEKTISSLSAQMIQTDDCCLNKYLASKYAVKDYKHSNQFKFKVCGAAMVDCYWSRNDKYFVKNIPTVNK